MPGLIGPLVPFRARSRWKSRMFCPQVPRSASTSGSALERARVQLLSPGSSALCLNLNPVERHHAICHGLLTNASPVQSKRANQGPKHKTTAGARVWWNALAGSIRPWVPQGSPDPAPNRNSPSCQFCRSRPSDLGRPANWFHVAGQLNMMPLDYLDEYHTFCLCSRTDDFHPFLRLQLPFPAAVGNPTSHPAVRTPGAVLTYPQVSFLSAALLTLGDFFSLTRHLPAATANLQSIL